MERLCIPDHPNPLARKPWVAIVRGARWHIAGDGLVLAAKRISETDTVIRNPTQSVSEFLSTDPAGFQSTGKVLWRLVSGARPRRLRCRGGVIEGRFDAGRLGNVWIDRSALQAALAALDVDPEAPCRIEAEKVIRIFGSGWRIALLPVPGPGAESPKIEEAA